MNLRQVVIILEVIITAILLSSILAIPYLEYDLNYAVLLYGSLFSTAAFSGFYFYWRKYTKGEKSSRTLPLVVRH